MGSHPLLCCVMSVPAEGLLCFLRGCQVGTSQSCSSLFLSQAVGLGMGGAEQDGRLCHEKQTARTPWTLWAAATGSAAPPARTLRPFLAAPPSRRESRLAGSSRRFLLALCVSLSLMASLCLGGSAAIPWFLCPAQASFCGDHDEYSGRVLEALVMKKEPFVVHCCFLPWNYPLCLRRRGSLGPGPGGQVSSWEFCFVHHLLPLHLLLGPAS